MWLKININLMMFHWHERDHCMEFIDLLWIYGMTFWVHVWEWNIYTFGVVFLLPLNLSVESLDHSSDFSDSSDCTCVAEHMTPQTPLLYTWNTNPDQTCVGHCAFIWVFCKWVQNKVSIKWYTTSYIILLFILFWLRLRRLSLVKLEYDGYQQHESSTSQSRLLEWESFHVNHTSMACRVLVA